MNTYRLSSILTYFICFAAVFASLAAKAEVGVNRNVTMVFDPDTKKYFVAGNAKFTLKQSDESSLIERIEVSIDGSDYTLYNGAVQFDREGKHTIKFRAINPVNNWSPVQFMEVFVDLAPPLTEAQFADGKFYSDGKVTYAALNSTITLAAQDNLSGVAQVEFSWDGVSFLPYTRPILIDRPGQRTLFFRSLDRVSNLEPVKRLDFIADGAGPTSEMKISGGALKPAVINGVSYLTSSDSVAFSLVAHDDESQVRQIFVALDGKPAAPYLKPLYFLQEGPHTLGYFSEDNVGNREEPKTVSLYTVSVAPRSNAVPMGKIVNTGGINFARKDLLLKLEARDNIVGLERIEYKFDADLNFRTYMEPIRFSREGVNTIQFRSIDRTGNIEPSRTFSVHVTEQSPDTALEPAQPLVVRDGVTYSPSPNIITLTVKNNGVGVEQTLVSIDDAPFQAYTGPFTLTSEQKVHKIAYKSIDKLGNEELPKTVTFHMIGNIPMVDLFITNEKNREEQVRTNYFENPLNDLSGSNRGVASQPGAGTAPAMMPSTPKPMVSPATAPMTAPPTTAGTSTTAPRPAPARPALSNRRGPN